MFIKQKDETLKVVLSFSYLQDSVKAKQSKVNNMSIDE